MTLLAWIEYCKDENVDVKQIDTNADNYSHNCNECKAWRCEEYTDGMGLTCPRAINKFNHPYYTPDPCQFEEREEWIELLKIVGKPQYKQATLF